MSTVYTITDTVNPENVAVGDIDDVIDEIREWFDLDAEYYTDSDTANIVTVGDALNSLVEVLATNDPIYEWEIGLGLRIVGRTDLDRLDAAAQEYASARSALRSASLELHEVAREALGSGLSEYEVARRSGLSRSTVRSINGKS